jgi:hypothetical protein
MDSALSGLKRFIFWDYARAVWQYDVMVGLILVFIFVTPREWFRDQPKASSVVMLPASAGEQAFWIEPGLLDGVPGPQQVSRAEALLKERTRKQERVLRIEPIFDSESEIKGYMAYARP